MMTKIYFAIVAVFFLGFIQAKAAVVTGTVKAGDKALGEVVVTDGYSFTVTDDHGRYSIDLNGRAEFVYLVTPKGYVADFSSGVPQFYQTVVKNKKEYNFTLFPMKGDPARFAMVTMADTQLDTESDVTRLMNETLPDVQQTIAEHKDVQTAGIVIGDITWDQYVRNDDYRVFARKLGIPIYPVIGNHDFDKYMTPSPNADYAHIYKKNFGPLYYAFQLGDVYYIVLNDLDYHGNKRYTTTLEMPDQMKWLELLLGMVLQQNLNVVIAMHAPLKPSSASPLIPGGDHLVQMLLSKPFKATFITGHYHANYNNNIGSGIMEHNCTAVCGAFWDGNTGNEGSPCGYQVFEYDGKQLSWYYKATGMERDCQFKLYPVGRVMDRPQSVVAKVWNWDDAWTIRWYEDGKPMGNMSRFYSYDPDYLAHLNGRLATADYEPRRIDHYFSATPSAGSHIIKVEVTDRFGKVYSQEIKVD